MPQTLKKDFYSILSIFLVGLSGYGTMNEMLAFFIMIGCLLCFPFMHGPD